MTTPAPIELAKAPSFRLDGKRALVTGAGRGIGLAAAAALAQAGAQVTLAARTATEIEAAAQAIRGRGERAQAMLLDVTDIAATRAAIGEAEPFDILVNNAGTNRPAYLRDVTVEDFDAIFSLNVRAAFFMAQAVVRRLIEAGRPGSIINVSSQMGHVGAARRSVYCASKHAMEGFTKDDGNRARAARDTREQPRADVPGNADDATILREQGVPRGGARKDQARPPGSARGDNRRHHLSRQRRFLADDGLGAHRRRWLDGGVRAAPAAVSRCTIDVSRAT